MTIRPRTAETTDVSRIDGGQLPLVVVAARAVVAAALAVAVGDLVAVDELEDEDREVVEVVVGSVDVSALAVATEAVVVGALVASQPVITIMPVAPVAPVIRRARRAGCGRRRGFMAVIIQPQSQSKLGAP